MTDPYLINLYKELVGKLLVVVQDLGDFDEQPRFDLAGPRRSTRNRKQRTPTQEENLAYYSIWDLCKKLIQKDPSSVVLQSHTQPPLSVIATQEERLASRASHASHTSHTHDIRDDTLVVYSAKNDGNQSDQEGSPDKMVQKNLEDPATVDDHLPELPENVELATPESPQEMAITPELGENASGIAKLSLEFSEDSIKSSFDNHILGRFLKFKSDTKTTAEFAAAARHLFVISSEDLQTYGSQLLLTDLKFDSLQQLTQKIISQISASIAGTYGIWFLINCYEHSDSPQLFPIHASFIATREEKARRWGVAASGEIVRAAAQKIEAFFRSSLVWQEISGQNPAHWFPNLELGRPVSPVSSHTAAFLAEGLVTEEEFRRFQLFAALRYNVPWLENQEHYMLMLLVMVVFDSNTEHLFAGLFEKSVLPAGFEILVNNFNQSEFSQLCRREFDFIIEQIYSSFGQGKMKMFMEVRCAEYSHGLEDCEKPWFHSQIISEGHADTPTRPHEADLKALGQRVINIDDDEERDSSASIPVGGQFREADHAGLSELVSWGTEQPLSFTNLAIPTPSTSILQTLDSPFQPDMVRVQPSTPQGQCGKRKRNEETYGNVKRLRTGSPNAQDDLNAIIHPLNSGQAKNSELLARRSRNRKASASYVTPHRNQRYPHEEAWEPCLSSKRDLLTTHVSPGKTLTVASFDKYFDQMGRKFHSEPSRRAAPPDEERQAPGSSPSKLAGSGPLRQFDDSPLNRYSSNIQDHNLEETLDEQEVALSYLDQNRHGSYSNFEDVPTIANWNYQTPDPQFSPTFSNLFKSPSGDSSIS